MEYVSFGFSFVALVIAGLAALFAKQQADAAVGKIVPFAEMNLGRRDQFGTWVHIDVRNPGNQTAYVEAIEFKSPQPIKIMHKASTVDKPMNGPSMRFNMGYPIPIPSYAAGAEKPPTRFVFSLLRGEAETHGGFDLVAKIRVKIGDGRWRKTIRCSAPVRPERRAL